MVESRLTALRDGEEAMVGSSKKEIELTDTDNRLVMGGAEGWVEVEEDIGEINVHGKYNKK